MTPAAVRDLIKSRRSVRGGFTDEPVSREDLLDLVEAGSWAPSTSNWQNVRFMIVTEPAEIARIGAIRCVWPYRTTCPPGGVIGRAKALIVVFVDDEVAQWYRRHNGEIWRQLDPQNAAAAVQNILLLAFAKGLGACWISALETMHRSDCLCGQTWADVWTSYDIPDSYEIFGIVMLGHRTDPAVGEKHHHGRAVQRRSPPYYIWTYDGKRMGARECD